MLTTRGWSAYRAQQEMEKRFRSHSAKKGWRTRRLLADLKDQVAIGFKSCRGTPGKLCLRQVRRDDASGRCGPCWSAIAAADAAARRRRRAEDARDTDHWIP